MIQNLTTPNIQTLNSYQLTDRTWFVVKLNMPTAEWVCEQPEHDWHRHPSADSGIFIVSEQLFTALSIKWQ